MAHSNRLAKRYLEHLIGDKEELYQQGFEPLLRYIDANAPLTKRLGYSVSPKQDAVRLGQTPLLHFHSSAFTGVSYDKVNGNYKLKNSYWGLLGINGPLPSHITEYAIERQYRIKDNTLTEFLDIFHHRFLSLFYRAWADAQPTVSHDRADSDIFSQRISVFSGSVAAVKRDFDAEHNRYQNLAGLYSQKNRGATSLAQILTQYLEHPVEINEFSGDWYSLQESEKTALGSANATLGIDSILGARTFQRSFNFSIVIGPLSYQDYIDLLGNKQRFSTLKELTIKTVGAEYRFSIKLVLKAYQTQPSHLGKARLGINSWCQALSANTLQKKTEIVYEQVC
jgi:type VI secretion system protein ImpH